MFIKKEKRLWYFECNLSFKNCFSFLYYMCNIQNPLLDMFVTIVFSEDRCWRTHCLMFFFFWEIFLCLVQHLFVQGWYKIDDLGEGGGGKGRGDYKSHVITKVTWSYTKDLLLDLLKSHQYFFLLFPQVPSTHVLLCTNNNKLMGNNFAKIHANSTLCTNNKFIGNNFAKIHANSTLCITNKFIGNNFANFHANLASCTTLNQIWPILHHSIKTSSSSFFSSIEDFVEWWEDFSLDMSQKEKLQALTRWAKMLSALNCEVLL